MSEEQDSNKIIEDLKASVLKRIKEIKEPNKQILTSISSGNLDDKDNASLNQKILNKTITKIYGPPGTGKTTTLINKVKDYIAKGTKPNDIGFFAFTNHSTNVAKAKIAEAYPNLKLDTDFKGFRTIHSMAYTTLQKSPNLLNEE